MGKTEGEMQTQSSPESGGKGRFMPVLQLSWLERYTDNVEVGSSTLPGTTKEDTRTKNQELRPKV